MDTSTSNDSVTKLTALSFKYRGAKFDAHVHLRSVEDTKGLVEVYEDFNVKKSIGITWEDKKKEYEEHFPRRFVFAKFLSSRELISGNIKSVIEEIDELHAHEYPVVKFWYAPRWRDYVEREWSANVKDFRLDDPKFEPIFSRIEDLGLILLIHVSDPDLFYQQKYQPPSKYGTKEEHLQELEQILARHSKLRVLGAHLGGQPEHLDNLGRWFDNYPNFFVDTASAKWMVREFTPQKEAVVRFFKKYADRILFGTDLVSGRTDRGKLPDYYINRYLTYQALWETSVRNLPLPFPDEENNNQTQINGLDLPLGILEKLYWKNSRRLFGI